VARFLIDENLPRSLAPRLREAGFEAVDIRDLGLRGKPDTEILEGALAHDAVLVTEDVGFVSLMREHPTLKGCVLVRLPNEWSTADPLKPRRV
jgi:predicted nuclease of predicted toxin-antitoxin system